MMNQSRTKAVLHFAVRGSSASRAYVCRRCSNWLKYVFRVGIENTEDDKFWNLEGIRFLAPPYNNDVVTKKTKNEG